jgi:lysozyme
MIIKHNADMRINQTGFVMLTDFEDFKPKPYDDGTGTLTIGYGHTRSAVMPAEVTEEEAGELLKADLEYFEGIVKQEVRVPINRNQFSALVSLTYNVGEGNFRNSTLLKKLNNGNFKAAAGEFESWNRAGGKKLEGLVRRRAAEKQLFNTQPQASVTQEMMSGVEFVMTSPADPETGVIPEGVSLNPAIERTQVLVTFATIEVYDPNVEEEMIEDDETTSETPEATGPTGIVT